jgi:hypothetical protein
MKPEQEDGGPAFPQASPEMVITGQSMGETQGMSLRDYFAAASEFLHNANSPSVGATRKPMP